MSQLQLGGEKEKNFQDFLSQQEEIDQIFQDAQILFNELQRTKVFGDPTDQSNSFLKTPLVLSTVADVTAGNELEVRFGFFKGIAPRKRFVPGVPKEYFYNLLGKLQSKLPTESEISIVYSFNDGTRIIESKNGKDHIERKTNVTNQDYEDWGVRISYSKEVPITKTNVYKKDDANFIRQRTRWSFLLDKKRRVDMTIVNNTFEVEIEYLNKISKEAIVKDILTTLSHMQKASIENVINEQDTTIAVNNLNSLFGAKTYDDFEKLENKPVSFEWSNVFYGGQYFITPKLDGVRRRLFFDKNGVFEVSPGSRYIRQIAAPMSYTKTVIDTEFFKGKYYPFDALVVDGNLLTSTRFAYRLEKLLTIQCSLFPEERKPFYSDDFYTSVGKCLEWMKTHSTLKYDGLIAQSNEPVYAGAATMKIKPLNELTVDLETRTDVKDQVRLYAWGGEELREVNLGKPGEKPSLKSEMGRYTVKNLKIPANAPKGNFIAEYRFIEKEPYLRFKGFRNDKVVPNYWGTVKNVYRDFFIDPITYADLQDGTLLPWRKWANSVKRKVINDFVPQGGRVLDIGIGRGGTMLETAKRASVVYGIDPDTDNLNALETRISTTEGENRRLLDKVQLCKGQGQDTEKIIQFIGAPVDVVLSMFSLSFFYKSEKDLDAFVKTCSESCVGGGKLIIMFMDGERTRQELVKNNGIYKNNLISIKSTVNNDLKNKNVVGVPITIELLTENDPIFRKQKEWLAPIDVLTQKLKEAGFQRLGSAEGGFLDSKAPLPLLNLEFARLNRLVAFEKVTETRGIQKEDFQIKVLAVGESAALGDKWIRHGVEWDKSSFLRSYLFTSNNSYKQGEDTDDLVTSLRASLYKQCTRERFHALKNGNVEGRIAFSLYKKSKEQAFKDAYKEYRKRIQDGPVGHEIAELLVVLYPHRKIIVIDEDDRELDRIGDGTKTSYILKVGNYAYSPLSKAEGYVHPVAPVKEASTGQREMISRFRKAVQSGDMPTIDELIVEGVDPAVDNNFAIRTAVANKNYKLVEMLSFLVNLDTDIVVVDIKGKETHRSLREDLVRLAGQDEKMRTILGAEKIKTSSKRTSKKVVTSENYESDEEGLLDEPETNSEEN